MAGTLLQQHPTLPVTHLEKSRDQEFELQCDTVTFTYQFDVCKTERSFVLGGPLVCSSSGFLYNSLVTHSPPAPLTDVFLLPFFCVEVFVNSIQYAI